MRITYVELLGEQYPLCFSLAASEKLSEIFGSLDNITKELDKGDVASQVKVVDAVLSVLMEAGQTYCKMAHIDCPPPLTCRPADVIDISDPSAVSAIFAAITSGNKREVEAETKNVEATQGK